MRARLDIDGKRVPFARAVTGPGGYPSLVLQLGEGARDVENVVELTGDISAVSSLLENALAQVRALARDAAESPSLTRGAKLLRVHPASQAEIASALGVSKQAVSAWVTGVARPTAERMAQIERTYGIPMIAWTEIVGSDHARVLDEEESL